MSPYERHFLGTAASGWPAPRRSNPLPPGDTERVLAALETMRPWAQERGREDWLDAAQKRIRMLGRHAGGTESLFPYQMAHEYEPLKTTAAVQPEWWRVTV